MNQRQDPDDYVAFNSEYATFFSEPYGTGYT